MKSGSKRGAALAYVIVITAALMILAAALVSAAKFNIDYSQNSLEGRQAYLDAKSAIEYGKAYLQSNPDSGDFTVVYASDASGFKIGAENATNTAAKYSATARTINATGKYKSSDRVHRLGYRMGKADSGDAGGIGGFMVSGSNYGDKFVFQNWWAPMLYQQVEAQYPVMFVNFLHIDSGEHFLKAPQVLLFGVNGSESVHNDYASHVEFTSDVIYVQKNILGSAGDKWTHNSPSRIVLKNLTTGRGVIIFGQNCSISGFNNIMISKGCYAFQSGVDLFQLSDDPSSDNYKYKRLTLLNEIPSYANISESVIDSPDQVLSGDAQNQGETTHGAHWSYHGGFNSDNKPRYIIYKKQIQQYVWINDGNSIIENYTAGVQDYEEKIIDWYLKDTGNWGSVLWGNNIPSSNDYYTNVSNVYIGKEINLQYVNAAANFTIPEYKTVVFKADSITLNTQFTDTAAGDGSSRPKITHGGSTAQFILEALNASDTVKLHVPNILPVEYKNSSGPLQSYQIKAGYYTVKQMNLFSDQAKTFFANNPPKSTPDGGSGGSGSSGGGTEVTGGVYTDG